MADPKEKRRAVSISVPVSESQILIETAEKMNVSITMVLRMLIREHLMSDPIKFPAQVQ